jgi:integrase
VTDLWTYEVGIRPYRVIAEERGDRHGMVYLRFWTGTNWTRETTGERVRTKGGALVKSKCAAIEKLARQKYADLSAGVGPEPSAPKRLTIVDGLLKAMDRHRGLYPKDTPHRREVERELRRVAAILGEHRTWDSIRRGDIVEIYRKRAATLRTQGHDGKRGAEITVARLLAVGEWLRGEELIPEAACRAPLRWKKVLGDELEAPEPHRPRHTVEELRKILAAAPQVDPRLALALQLGAELRLGQVLRVRRSDVDLDAGMLRVRGKGKKGGQLVKLIPTQLDTLRWAVAGFLAPLEALGTDYPLLPAGQLTGGRKTDATPVCRKEQATGGSVGRRTALAWFHEAEAVAGVPSIPGRGWVGLRRGGVDGAKGLGVSREVLKEFGGWSDTQVPDGIYADQESLEAIGKAADARASIRGVV